MLREVRARDAPVTAGDKPQWFSRGLVSRPLYSGGGGKDPKELLFMWNIKD